LPDKLKRSESEKEHTKLIGAGMCLKADAKVFAEALGDKSVSHSLERSLD